MNEVLDSAGGRHGRRRGVALAVGLVAFLVLIALGVWQVQRLHWKEGLLATIDQRMHSAPLPLSDVEQKFAETGDVDYMRVKATGTFFHGGERHFFTTWDGKPGFNVYTPLRLEDGRFVLVNRGFVPYDSKDPAKRPEGQISGEVTVTGLARNPLPQKPSIMLPDNEPAKNLFYWKDRDTMAASAGLPAGYSLVPIFIDADDTPNPGGLPIGGVTIVSLPNNHFQYALTWFGLAAALAVVLVLRLRRPAEPD
jgi:surfeit locus 1 family protein